MAPNPIQGYTTKGRLIADLCNRYPQVESVTLNGFDGHYVDCYERGDLAAANQIYADPHRFNRFVEQWRGARWQKMALKVFKLPDGEGGLRKPYLMPSDAEVERFTTGLLALGLAEIDELARAAGLG